MNLEISYYIVPRYIAIDTFCSPIDNPYSDLIPQDGYASNHSPGTPAPMARHNYRAPESIGFLNADAPAPGLGNRVYYSSEPPRPNTSQNTRRETLESNPIEPGNKQRLPRKKSPNNADQPCTCAICCGKDYQRRFDAHRQRLKRLSMKQPANNPSSGIENVGNTFDFVGIRNGQQPENAQTVQQQPQGTSNNPQQDALPNFHVFETRKELITNSNFFYFECHVL